MILWTENKNVTISDRFICFILMAKRRWRPVFWGRQLKKGRQLFLRKKVHPDDLAGVFSVLEMTWLLYCADASTGYNRLQEQCSGMLYAVVQSVPHRRSSGHSRRRGACDGSILRTRTQLRTALSAHFFTVVIFIVIVVVVVIRVSVLLNSVICTGYGLLTHLLTM